VFVLDTNVAIALLADNAVCRAALDRKLDQRESVALATMVEFELWYGVYGGERQVENASRLREFLSGPLPVLVWDSQDGITAAEIRAFLKHQGTPIGPYDVLIAAQALRRDATLVTANLGEFARVPGLKCVNWEEGT